MASRHSTKELAEDFISSGLSRKRYCLEKGLSPSTLAYHLRKHRKGQEPQHPEGTSFVPVDSGTDKGGSLNTLMILRGHFTPEELAQLVSRL